MKYKADIKPVVLEGLPKTIELIKEQIGWKENRTGSISCPFYLRPPEVTVSEAIQSICDYLGIEIKKIPEKTEIVAVKKGEQEKNDHE